MATYSETVLSLLTSPDFQRATFTGPQRLQKSPYTRITLRRILLQGIPHLSISSFDARQDTTRNFPISEISNAVAPILAIGFANVHIAHTSEEFDIRLTKKGDVTLGKSRSARPAAIESHNRVKNVPLPEGTPSPILSALGILDRNNNVRPTMRGKYTQINEFLKLLDHVLDEVPPQDEPLTILDCGCGSAYLTLATHHFLNDIKKRPARVLGVDVNEALIAKCTAQSESLFAGSGGAQESNLQFLAGRIGSLEATRADIVLALHACDTATDDALAQAVRSNARVILAVPCCHKNLNRTLQADVLNPLHRHGILHQRLADLATDAFRAQLLRILGYKAEVIEFISPEHTARNLMIRAVKTPVPVESRIVHEYMDMKTFFHVTTYLESALSELLPPSLSATRQSGKTPAS